MTLMREAQRPTSIEVIGDAKIYNAFGMLEQYEPCP